MTIQEAINKFPEYIEKALLSVGKVAVGLSNDYAPVFTSDLRDTGHVELDKTDKSGMLSSINLVWGGKGNHGLVDYAKRHYYGGSGRQRALRHYFLGDKPVSILDNFRVKSKKRYTPLKQNTRTQKYGASLFALSSFTRTSMLRSLSGGAGKKADYARALRAADRAGALKRPSNGLRWVEKALATERNRKLIARTFVKQFGL